MKCIVRRPCVTVSVTSLSGHGLQFPSRGLHQSYQSSTIVCQQTSCFPLIWGLGWGGAGGGLFVWDVWDRNRGWGGGLGVRLWPKAMCSSTYGRSFIYREHVSIGKMIHNFHRQIAFEIICVWLPFWWGNYSCSYKREIMYSGRNNEISLSHRNCKQMSTVWKAVET